ncbi:hypothetical protein G5V58_24985 [Nocardioides anomalus]|uniref:Uncharacterized protein n=1 Tax=Nocardioides anomalus TaxID=2712223 RepID=A0A6G6WK40_9ACTN|nr:hypothetical protein [Nocardioides anomalus]QIG45566.1 hypothetical protein G5V58_24985 [Nocardioides anomalus]
MTQLLGMDTTAGLATGDTLARGAEELLALAGRLESSLHAFDWTGPDAERVRDGWSATERPALDAAARFVAALAAALREEARSQDEVSGDGGAGSGAAAPSALTTPQDPAAQQVRALTDRAQRRGLQGEALQRYHDRLAAMTPEQVAALDPTRFHGTQPDQTTCGSASLVMSRMINDPAYAMKVLDGYDPATGQTTGGDAQSRFGAEALAMHHQTNGWHSRDGELNPAWPEGWGTHPHDAAREMSAAGGSGVPGTTYGWHLVGDRGSSYDQIAQAVRAGHTVPVYVGDWAPRHVVLATASDAGSITFYEPGGGQSVTVTREQWLADRESLGGWHEPWFVVTPDR